MDSKFFTFIKPYLNFIDTGKIFKNPFSWLYIVLAILNLLLPLFILYQGIDGGIFSSPGKYIIYFILIWIVLACTGWIEFQLWWDRKDKVLDVAHEDADFVATPVFSHFIQTVGEWLGTFIAIVGFFSTLFGLIFFGGSSGSIIPGMNIAIFEGGVLNLVLLPVFGFLILVIFRFLAELYRALAAIANNTKK